MVPVSEPLKKVVPVFEPGKRSCQYLIFTLKVVPLYDVNPFFYYGSNTSSRMFINDQTSRYALFICYCIILLEWMALNLFIG